MKQSNLLYIIFLLAILACKEKEESLILIPEFHIPKETSMVLSQLLTDRYEITQLETSPESIIGKVNKIKKFKNNYYILSNRQWIFHFNENGQFIGCLNKKGEAPEEYLKIEDFNIYQSQGETEIWVGDGKNIKIYDAYDFTIKEKISYPFVVHKFQKIDENTILLLTGQNDYSLTISDKTGDIKSEYLKKEIPYLLFKPIQFIQYGSDFLYQLGICNTYIGFDPQSQKFYKGIFSPDNRFLSDRQILEMFNKYGHDFMKEANNHTYINTIIPFKDITWINSFTDKKRYLTKVYNGQEVSASIWPSCSVKNDLFSLSTAFLYTINMGESEDSLLLYIPSDLIEDNEEYIYDKKGELINITLDSNPCIIEFY